MFKFRITAFFILCCTTLFGSETKAQIRVFDRNAYEQIPFESTNPNPILYRYKPRQKKVTSPLKETLKNLHGGYSVSLMGPRLLGNSNETYNVFLDDVAPIQLFHAANLSIQINPDLTIGIGGAAVQNLSNNIIGNTGVIRNQSFVWFDPTLFFNMPNLFKPEGWFVFTSLSLAPPITEASQNIKKIFEMTLSQSFTKDLGISDWNMGFRYSFNPQFYADPLPDGITNRQIFNFNFGHLLGYRISKEFSIQTSTTFDVEKRTSPTQEYPFLGSNLGDRFRAALSFIPRIPGMNLSIGGYTQFLIWNPRPETTILGADFAIGF